MKPSRSLVLSNRDRRRLRGLLYGVRIGGLMTRDDFDFLEWVEKRLAPSKMRAADTKRAASEAVRQGAGK